MPPDLPALFAAEKTLVTAPDWVEGRSDQLSLVSSLDIDGVTVEGLRLRMTTFKPRWEECVVAQVEYIPTKRDLRGGALCRVEWRPLTGHNNKGNGPAEFRFLEQTGSHHHPFELNWVHQASALRRGNLPIAVPLNPDPPSFKGLIDLLTQEFRIPNLGWVPPPPWERLIV